MYGPLLLLSLIAWEVTQRQQGRCQLWGLGSCTLLGVGQPLMLAMHQPSLFLKSTWVYPFSLPTPRAGPKLLMMKVALKVSFCSSHCSLSQVSTLLPSIFPVPFCPALSCTIQGVEGVGATAKVNGGRGWPPLQTNLLLELASLIGQAWKVHITKVGEQHSKAYRDMMLKIDAEEGFIEG